jgi:ribosomal protein S18 acetylase RimI-like enzyme
MLETFIRQARVEDVETLTTLFDNYRSFYGRKSDLEKAKNFIWARLNNQDSKIFIAEAAQSKIVAFTQLYPTFSSISAKSSWILNDLYVIEKYRRNRIASKLVKHAVEFANSTCATSISLQTGKDNLAAQSLYEQLNFVKDDYFLSYSICF